MKIPFAKPDIHERDSDYVVNAINSGWISDGEYIHLFESRLKDILKSKYVLTTSNGTSALNLALLAVKDYTDKRSILVPAFCFHAAANVALQLGFTPVFYDVDPHTMQADIKSLESKVGSSTTAAIVVVHNYGYVCKEVPFLELLATYYNDALLIEDCAEAIFSTYPGTDIHVGNKADIGTFSLHATKTLTTGEGGLITTQQTILNDYLMLCRSHGLEKRGSYNHIIPGNNFRMSNILAAFGCGQLDYYPYLVERKLHIQNRYFGLLNSIAEFLPPFQETSTIWSLPVRITPEVFKYSRDDVMFILQEHGIETRPGFVSSNKLKYFEKSDTPVADILSDTVLVLPAFTSIHDHEIKFICDTLLSLRR